MRIETPQITTLIPTYRRPYLLRRAIRSVLDQTYPHLRVCVFDNASGDETAAVVAKLANEDPRVTYHCHAENIGLSANFAYAMQHVDTPFFSMLADDDYYLPAFFETAMVGFDDHPDVIASGGAMVMVTERGKIVYTSSLEGYFCPPDGLLKCTIGSPPLYNYVYRSEVLKRGGMIDMSIPLWDIDFLWQIFSRFSYVLSKEPSTVIVYHDKQTTRQIDIKSRLESYHSTRTRLDTNDALPADVRSQAEKALEATFSKSMFAAAVLAFLGGDYARTHQSADALRSQFHKRNAARALDLLATMCQHVKPAHSLIRVAFLALQEFFFLIRTGKHRALRGQIRGILAQE